MNAMDKLKLPDIAGTLLFTIVLGGLAARHAGVENFEGGQP